MAAERITVYPARFAGDRWRAAWHEPDGRHGQCEAPNGGRLSARLKPVIERLAADVPNLLRPGSALIEHYLSPGRLVARAAVVTQARRYPAGPLRPVSPAIDRREAGIAPRKCPAADGLSEECGGLGRLACFRVAGGAP